MVSAGRANGVTGDDFVLRIDGAAALSITVVKAVEEVCARFEAHGGTAVVRVSGAPDPAWLAGADVALVSKWERVVRRLERLNAVTVAVAEGDVGGLALDVLLATDHRIAAPGARLLVPVEAGASWPGMAVFRLANQAGVAAVRQAVLLGRPIPIHDALALNLVHEIAEDPRARLAELTGEFAAVPGKELAIRRQLLADAGVLSFEDALGAHLAACDRVLRQAALRVVP